MIDYHLICFELSPLAEHLIVAGYPFMENTSVVRAVTSEKSYGHVTVMLRSCYGHATIMQCYFCLKDFRNTNDTSSERKIN